MWSSNTNYSELYSKSYFGKLDEATSFDKLKLPQAVSRLCLSNGLSGVIDIGAGSGFFGKELSRQGLSVISCDIEPSNEDIRPYKLSEFSLAQNAKIREEFSLKNNASYLVTCFDVLEHIDKEDLLAALRNLRQLVDEWLLVSISTRPSSRGNSYHSTVLPIQTWTELFRVFGLEVHEKNALPDCRTVMEKSRGAPELLLVDYWIENDIFSDINGGEPNYLLLRNVGHETDLAAEQVKDILDLRYLEEKRNNNTDLSGFGRIGLNIQHFQDFLTFRPILDVIKQAEVVVFLRDPAPSLMPDERDAIKGFFRRSATTVIEYHRVSEIDFSSKPIATLVSASESTVALNHILSLELVEQAKLHSIPTLLLQHGIWIETFGVKSIPFSSQHVLSWGREHENFFTRLVGEGRRGGVKKFHAIGAPKFFDILCNSNKGVAKYRLGIEVEKFKKVVLLGTNLHWTEHSLGRPELITAFRELISKNKDNFFILKCHPSERASQYKDLKNQNCMVVDDVLLTCLDLTIGRLLQSIDVVITSLSTLLLDAAIAGARCIQYETNNRFSYQYCKAVALSGLGEALADDSFSSVTSEFVAHYADCAGTGFYEAFFTLLRTQQASPLEYKEDAIYAVARSTENLWLKYVEVEEKLKSLHNTAAGVTAAKRPELPADFDPAKYLDLHPDVKKAGVDPARHYLDHGFFENRSYK